MRRWLLAECRPIACSTGVSSGFAIAHPGSTMVILPGLQALLSASYYSPLGHCFDSVRDTVKLRGLGEVVFDSFV